MFDIGVGIFAIIGVISTAYFSIRTLRLSQKSAALSHQPKLLFGLGSQVVTAKFIDAASIPGISPRDTNAYLNTIPSGSKFLLPLSPIGNLTNIGKGTAAEVKLTFAVQSIERNEQEILIYSEKEKNKFEYALENNTFVLEPSSLEAGNEGKIYRIPTPIVVDYEKSLSKISGVMTVYYKDMLGGLHRTRQSCVIMIEYRDDDSAELNFAFGIEVT